MNTVRIPIVEISGFFRWYDLWIGAFWDRKTRTLYVCPVPTLGIKIVFGRART